MSYNLLIDSEFNNNGSWKTINCSFKNGVLRTKGKVFGIKQKLILPDPTRLYFRVEYKALTPIKDIKVGILKKDKLFIVGRSTSTNRTKAVSIVESIEDEEVESTISENASQSQQDQPTDNPPQTDQQTDSEAESRQKSNLIKENDPRQKQNYVIQIDAEGTVLSVTPSNNDTPFNVLGLTNDDGTVELAISELENNELYKFLTSQTALFNIDSRVVSNNTEGVITSNPVIKFVMDEVSEVVDKGEIVVQNEEEQAEQQQRTSTNSSY